MNTSIRCTAFALLVVSLTGVAAADTADDALATRTVNYSDLNLSHAAGAAALYKRIHRAARQVCEPRDTPDLSLVGSSRRCVEQAIARAIDDVNVPALTNYYLAQTNSKITMARR